jgi:peptidyl-prolyl cis-trans isomerase A (cyclophilin A)
MKALIVLLATGSVMLAQTPAPTKSAAPATKAAPPVAKAPTESALLHPDTLKAKAPAEFKVKFTTTKGDFVVAVHRDWSPLGADRFYNLVKNRFFTNAAFFRIVPNFIVQFGLAADPKVSAVWQNANIKDDPGKPANSNKKGTLVFATAGPNTRTTQFFINLKDNTPLDAQGFTAFGEVTEGMDVVAGLYANYGEQPQQPLITAQGKAYLDKNFPKLDSIKSAAVLPAEGAAPAATPATKSAATARQTGAPATKSTTVARKSTAAPATKSTAVARKSTAAPATKSTAVRKSTAAPAKQ